MNEPLLIERQRLVLRELARLKADKAKSEAALAETLKSRKESAAQLQKKTLAQLETRFQQDTAAAKAESEHSRQSLLAHFAQEHPVAAQEYEAIKETSEDQYQDAKEKIRKEHEEYRWTTGTVFEASEKKIQAPFQAIQQQVTAATQRAKDLRAEGEEVLKLWRLGSLASGKKFAGKPDRHHADPQRNLKASLAEGEELLAELKALRVPRAFQGLRLLWAFLALWAVFAISLFFLYPSGLVGGKYHWLAVATGFAFLIELALAALLYVSARFKARDVYRPMCFSLADAEVTAQAWLQKAQAAYQEQLNKLEQEKNQRDEKLEQAKERYRQVKANLRERRDKALTQAEEKYPKLLASLVHNRDEGLRQAEEKYRRQLLLNKERLEKERRQTDENLQRELAACDQEQTQTKQAIMQSSLRGLAKVRNLINEVLGECGQLFPPWQHPSWTEWSSPADAPSVLRFGEYEVGLREQAGDLFGGGRWPQEMPAAVAVPALLQFPERCSMLWRTRDAGRAAAVASMQGTMFRFLTTLPAGKVRFTIIDPVGLGENFSSFMHLADYDEQLVASRIWTEGQHIEQRLADIAAHMENVIQKYLRNQFASIQEYNAQAGEVAEPFRVLVVANFPTNFTPDAARRLVSIAASGASCGVYTLVSVDTAQPMPSGFNLADLEQSSVTLSWKDQRFIWKEPDFESFPLKLDSVPEDEMLNRVLRTVGQQAREANRVEVPFDFIAPKPAEWWQSSSKTGIDVPLGRAGATKRQHLRLGKGTSQHVLIAGKTGSGKSTLLHALITNLSLLYSPEEVELYLVDFKKGVEFKTYVTHQLPHARVVAVESEREFGLSVLQRLDAELKQRGDRFRSLGVQNLSDFRDTSPDTCPRILLIVDEFQEFFVEDDKIAQESALLLDRLVRQGRAFGLHILLGSQTLGGAYSLARSTIDQMAVRIALQCSEADGHLILSKDNSAARLLTRPGEAIYNDANGLVEGNDIFQVVWLPDERREELLEETNKLNQDREHIRRSQIVFEGNTPADLRKNTLFANLLDRPSWPESSASFSAWLGDAIAIKDPTAAVFVRQTCSNLLLVGHQEEAGLSILTTTLLGLGCQVPPLTSDGLPSFTILDSIAADSAHAGCWDALARVLPQTVAIGAWRDVPAKLGEIAAEVDRRLKTNEAESPPLFLFVHGLQRFKDLRKQDDDFGFSRREDKALPPSKLLEHILREGPAVGVHALIWCDTLTNVQRAFDRQTMRDFGMRVLFQMSPNDSSTLIDSPAAGKLGLHRALFCSEDLGTIEKFRPYGLLDEEWVSEVGRRLREKSIPSPASADVGT